jgi:hypothetical protein
MSDEEFRQAKRICERHGYQVRRVGGVELGKPGFVINPDHVASIQVTGGVVRINWAAREAEVFDLRDADKAKAVAESIRAHWS